MRTGIANQYQRSAYAVLDASIAYTQYWLRPYVCATNLTDTSYEPIYGILMPGRAAVVGIEMCPICRRGLRGAGFKWRADKYIDGNITAFFTTV